MKSHLAEMAEILEEDSIGMDDVLADFEAWDSLTILSLIVLVDEKFGVQVHATDIQNCTTVQSFVDFVDNEVAQGSET